MDGLNIVGCSYKTSAFATFKAINPANGQTLEGEFEQAGPELVDEAMRLASEAFVIYKNIGKDKKAAFLRAIADEINALGDALIERAAAESGLPVARLTGERARTTGQLNLFADLVEEGSWVEAIIDTALPDRKPLPRPDLRKMLVPMGPVVVFGASNFPLAFSVAGGDTASALAAGCPVIVKAHAAHPGTSALVGKAIMNATQKSGMPHGVFSLLFDDGFSVGAALLKHEQTRAAAFTGSYKGGIALQQLVQQRRIPIPLFTEMGSINPVIMLPLALEKRAGEIAEMYATSITLGAGQFCTNPGLLLAIRSEGLTRFEGTLAQAISKIPPAVMLTGAICKNYHTHVDEILREEGMHIVAVAGKSDGYNHSRAVVAKISAGDFIKNPKLKEEIFGPYSLLVVCNDEQQLEELVHTLDGQLTVSFMAELDELASYPALVQKTQEIAGRIMLNMAPTGVEVSAAMQHGGPYPATSDSRFTSVGTSAIRRFVRPVCWQNWQHSLLPAELKDDNPLKIWRMVDQKWTKD